MKRLILRRNLIIFFSALLLLKFDHTSAVECGSGYYIALDDESGLSYCSPCLKGTFNSQPDQTECTLCPVGSYQDVQGAHNCTECPHGTFSLIEGSATPSNCIPCHIGTYNPYPGQGVCVSCPSGTANPDRGAVSQFNCAPCMDGTVAFKGSPVCCPIGMYLELGLSPACKYCPEGFFADASGTDRCTPCAPGSSSHPFSTTCTPCPGGFYSLGGSPCTMCPTGTSSASGSSTCVLTSTSVPSTSPSDTPPLYPTSTPTPFSVTPPTNNNNNDQQLHTPTNAPSTDISSTSISSHNIQNTDRGPPSTTAAVATFIVVVAVLVGIGGVVLYGRNVDTLHTEKSYTELTSPNTPSGHREMEGGMNVVDDHGHISTGNGIDNDNGNEVMTARHAEEAGL
eukprot:gene4081-8118_t